MEDGGRRFNPRESERKQAVLPPFKQRQDFCGIIETRRASLYPPNSKIRRDGKSLSLSKERVTTMEQKPKGWIFTEAETITTFQPGHWTWYPHCKMPSTFGGLTKEQKEEVELHKIHQCSGRNFVQESRERLAKLKEQGILKPFTVKGTDTYFNNFNN